VTGVEFHPEAQDELNAAAQFYEHQAEGLGLDFIMTVHRTSERLLESPASGSPFGRRLRRLLVPTFPYGLLYRVEPERIYIIAVMHLHRRPGYWRSRRRSVAAQQRGRADRWLAFARRELLAAGVGRRNSASRWSQESAPGHMANGQRTRRT
jgi:plasmid stabilization system protein ParE